LDDVQRVKDTGVSGADESGAESGVEEGSQSEEDIDEKGLSQLDLEDVENRKRRRENSSPFVDGISLIVLANCR
jgi:hypothetical protein